MKNDKVKLFDNINELNEFIKDEKVVTKGITTFGGKFVLLYYEKEEWGWDLIFWIGNFCLF